MAAKLSLVVITKNSSHLLGKTLRSVKSLVNEIVIVDDYSIDQTIQIAKSFSAKIFLNHESDLGKQRNYALSKTTNEWILILDADEYVSKPLNKEIKVLLSKKPKYLAFMIPFQNHFLGIPINHGGEQYSQLRLFNKNAVQISPALLHENFLIKKGEVGKLTHKIYHYSYQTYAQIISKFTNYALREAKQKKSRAEKTSLKKIIMYPLHMFYTRFIKDKGYKDGLFRIPLDIAFAYMEFLTYTSMIFIKKKDTSSKLTRIAIDAGDFCPETDVVKSGITRLIYQFTQETKRSNFKNVQITVYYFGSKKAQNISSKVRFRKLPKLGFASVFLPIFVIFDENTSYISFSSHVPYLLTFTAIKKVAFLYDIAFQKYPQYYANFKKINKIFQNAVKRADSLITLTKYVAQEIVNKYENASYKITCIYPGIDHVEKLHMSKPKKYFLYVGVIKPIKNIETLLDCFNSFLASSKDKSYKLILVGNWEENYYKLLVKNLKYRQIKKNIIFTGQISDKKLIDYYQYATAVINTSYAEGFGFPVLEALAMNKIVLVNNLPIYEEFKVHFKNLLISSSDMKMIENMKKTVNRRVSIAMDDRTNLFKWKIFTKKLITLASH